MLNAYVGYLAQSISIKQVPYFLFNNLELRPNKAKNKMVKLHTQFTIYQQSTASIAFIKTKSL